ncbi:placenta-specific gene 8 protein-like [Saccoglossus kowalevskii]|uniref:Placenta-specific gene 8 protein-like n=1 Tax=Saccoglossus kowalevskii TaxID=10224 RepID=A0ABM0M1G5_SACKO|nr:PREDICTED: placenta-specific gene 8 protein-like [Saccoglossus kowalevskii]
MEEKTGGAQVVMSQPSYVQSQNPNNTTNVIVVEQNGFWSTGLFGCFGDLGSCLAATFCLPCYRCYLADKVGENMCMPCCVCPPNDLIVLRMKIRTMNNIQGGAISDCCASYWCPCCAATQISREWDSGH